MDTHKKIREHISALADGALCSNDLELAMVAMQTDDGSQAWHLYHRIGDVLRAQGTPELSDDFACKLAARLADEPLPLRRQTKAAAVTTQPGIMPATLAAGPQPAAAVHLLPAGPAPAMAAAPADDAAQEGAAQEGAALEGVAVASPKPAIITVS